jgi:hypothetical protein
MSGSEQKPSGFTVTDRRAFSGEGEARDQQQPEPQAGAAASPPPDERQDKAHHLPPADFTTFILSLSSSALMHLGELPGGQQGQPARDLPMAKHTIDLLSLLQEKTRGNLSADEDSLLESLLYDLRLRYVELAKGAK